MSLIFTSSIGKAHKVYDTVVWRELSLPQWLDLFRPELFGGLGLFFLVLSVLSLSSRLILPFIFSYSTWLIISLLELIGTGYYAATKDTNLDIPIILHAISNIEDLWPVFMSETRAGTGLIVSAALLLVFITSLILKTKAEHKCIWLAEKKARLLLLPVASIICLCISLWPSFYYKDIGYTQSFSYNILKSIGYTFERLGKKNSINIEDRQFPYKTNLVLRDDHQERRNLVVVILESTRASATGIYNSAMKTTPYMVELAKRSEVFQRVYTVVPHTSKAIVGILCGVEPGLYQHVDEATVPSGIPVDCLASTLGDQGYKSVFFQTATETFEDRKGLVRNMGYQEFFSLESIKDQEGYKRVNYFGVEDDAILPLSEEWLDAVGVNPFFATYLTLTTHHPYGAPHRYGKQEFSQEEKFNRYLNSVFYQDHFIKNLIAQYKEKGLYNSTIFVLVGDHGEGFGEHGRLQHDTVIYNEGLHVPLLIHDTQYSALKTHWDPMSTIDIAPTVLDRMGYSFNQDSYVGRSYETRKEAAIFSHCWRVRACMSIIRGKYKLVHHFENREDELFDLDTDPRESKNLADNYPEMVNAMLAEMLIWRENNIRQYGVFRTQLVNE